MWIDNKIKLHECTYASNRCKQRQILGFNNDLQAPKTLDLSYVHSEKQIMNFI